MAKSHVAHVPYIFSRTRLESLDRTRLSSNPQPSKKTNREEVLKMLAMLINLVVIACLLRRTLNCMIRNRSKHSYKTSTAFYSLGLQTIFQF